MKNNKSVNNAVKNGSSKKVAAKVKPVAKKAAKKKASKRKAAVRFPMLFGKYSPARVAKALGKAKWSPADAVTAITKKVKGISPRTIRTCVFRGRHGVGSKPAPLSGAEFAMLKKLAA